MRRVLAAESGQEAVLLMNRFAPHPGEVVQRVGDFTCYSQLMARGPIGAACISGETVVRFSFY
jgi:hypothetical protein